MSYSFLTSCASIPMSDVGALQEMTDQSTVVSYRTFMRHVPRDEVAQCFPDYDWSKRPHDLTLKRDWHVGYRRSSFKGARCYYLVHSAYEYIWTEQ